MLFVCFRIEHSIQSSIHFVSFDENDDVSKYTGHNRRRRLKRAKIEVDNKVNYNHESTFDFPNDILPIEIF